MKSKFEIEVACLPSEEDLVCEIYYDGFQWVQIFRKNSQNLIQFYSHPTNNEWEFSLNDALEVLEMAKEKFLKYQ